jgi:hypothetical protein
MSLLYRWVGLRVCLDVVQLLALPEIESQLLSCPARNESLYRLSY